MYLHHHAGYRRAIVLPVNSSHWSSCYTILEKPANSSSTHVSSSWTHRVHFPYDWVVATGMQMKRHFQAWKSITCAIDLSHSFCFHLLEADLWSHMLKMADPPTERAWVLESLLEREPAINKEYPFRILQEQEINFFLVCPNIYFGGYGFHQLAYSN